MSSGFTPIGIAMIIVVVVIVALVIMFIVMYNGLVAMRNRVEEAFATMDVYLKKRFDLVPNLVEAVKGYAQHESRTLDQVVRARSLIESAGTQEQRLAGEAQLTGTLRSLFAVAEGYPELKANANFLGLQGDLGRIEDDIANARRYYNAVVRDYNTKTETFPSLLVASLFRFERKQHFEVTEASERENVKVSF